MAVPLPLKRYTACPAVRSCFSMQLQRRNMAWSLAFVGKGRRRKRGGGEQRSESNGGNGWVWVHGEIFTTTL